MSIRTIVVTGPESSGKTTLANALARHLACPLVPEAARELLAPHTPYTPGTLLRLARAQVDGERAARQHNPALVVADTDLQVLRIWWQKKFGPCPRDSLERNASAAAERFYLLCRPDLPWETDPLRENPQDRDRLFDLYRADLAGRDLNYGIVEGRGNERLACALHVLPQGLTRLSRRDASTPV